ncbi:hypothetical protein BJP36_41495 [Moorena producens JHB]|uniref:Uncharacterized protein n=1 Tax=Moorena producens (strain JHB) TaxID=1454205 RepID=A0A9Q9UVH7_MOOP1|nr:hypothetical protein [Moorena producens]WAN68838.1 hypothetical protein BJP36_41495 [Moorena producens JHB]
MKLKRLREFSQNVYNQMRTAKDAVFELMDAAILTLRPSCLAELSLSYVFRREWDSAYEALSDCRPHWLNLLKLFILEIPPIIQPILVADHSPYSLPDAVTLTEKTYEYQASSVSVNPPVGVG